MEGVGFEPGFIVWLLNFSPSYLFFLHPSSTNLSALSSFHCFQPLKSVGDQPFHSPLDYITPHHLRILIRQFSPVLFIFDLPSALIWLILKNKNENKSHTKKQGNNKTWHAYISFQLPELFLSNLVHSETQLCTLRYFSAHSNLASTSPLKLCLPSVAETLDFPNAMDPSFT